MYFIEGQKVSLFMIKISINSFEQQLYSLTLAHSIIDEASQWLDFYGGHGDSAAIKTIERELQSIYGTLTCIKNRQDI